MFWTLCDRSLETTSQAEGSDAIDSCATRPPTGADRRPLVGQTDRRPLAIVVDPHHLQRLSLSLAFSSASDFARLDDRIRLHHLRSTVTG